MYTIRSSSPKPFQPATTTTEQPPVVRTPSPPVPDMPGDSVDLQHAEQQIQSANSTPIRGQLPYGAFDTPPRRDPWDSPSTSTTERWDRVDQFSMPSGLGPSPLYRRRRWGSESTTTTVEWERVGQWHPEPERRGLYPPAHGGVDSSPSDYEESPFRSPLPDTPDRPETSASSATGKKDAFRKLFVHTSPTSRVQAASSSAVAEREHPHWGYRLAQLSLVPIALFMISQAFQSQE